LYLAGGLGVLGVVAMLASIGPGAAASVHSRLGSRLAALSAPEAARGRIAFVTERDGDRELYAVNADGSDVQRLGRRPGADYAAPAGPDGEILAISVMPDDAEQLALVGGGRLEPFGPRSRFLRNPSWMPDGSALVVESDRSSFRDLYRVDRQGGVERLTQSEHGCFEPAVSPDGARVAYVATDGGDPEIHVLDLQSREVARLTWSRGEDSAPAWSPDGSEIVFVSARRGPSRIQMMRADGSRPRPLTAEGAASQRDPAFSPDGAAVAFVEVDEGRSRIVVARASDGAMLGASKGLHRDDEPAWSPDGRWIAFSSDREGDRDIHVMRWDGSAVRRITSDRADDWLPRWVGQPPTLAFTNAGSLDPR
jgi:Tol biopolymer transport system component